jgi:hypothetical protein
MRAYIFHSILHSVDDAPRLTFRPLIVYDRRIARRIARINGCRFTVLKSAVNTDDYTPWWNRA